MKIHTLLAAALVAAVLAGPAVMADEEPAQPANVYEKMIAEKADSIVYVKFVLKMQLTMQGQTRDQERNQEVRGAIIDSSGLVITSSSHFGLPPGIQRMVRMQGGDVKGTPTDMKVMFGNEVEEYAAQRVATDSNLGLTFVQILDLGDREVKAVDLGAGGPLRIGTEIFGVSRLERGFDCAPSVGKSMVTAKVEKPRKMWAISGSVGGVGLPVFDGEGRPVGVLSLQEGSEGVGGGGMGGMMGSGGGPSIAPFVLPLKTIARSVDMARERGAEAVEQAKKNAGTSEEAPDKPEDE